MSLNLLQLQSLLLELQSRLAGDLEIWSHYSSQGEERLSFPKELATERMSLLSHQLEMAKDSLSQLESQMETVNWKALELESAKEWE